MALNLKAFLKGVGEVANDVGSQFKALTQLPSAIKKQKESAKTAKSVALRLDAFENPQQRPTIGPATVPIPPISVAKTIKESQKAQESLYPEKYKTPLRIPLTKQGETIPFVKGNPIMISKADQLTPIFAGILSVPIYAVTSAFKTLYQVPEAIKTQAFPRATPDSRVISAFETGNIIQDKLLQSGVDERMAAAAGILSAGAIGVMDTAMSGGIVKDMAFNVLKQTRFNPQLDYSLQKLGIERGLDENAFVQRLTKRAEEIKTRANPDEMREFLSNMKFVAENGGAKEASYKLNELGKQMQNLSRILVQPEGYKLPVGAPIGGESTQALPGFRPTKPEVSPMGLSIQEVERVGGEPIKKFVIKPEAKAFIESAEIPSNVKLKIARDLQTIANASTDRETKELALASFRAVENQTFRKAFEIQTGITLPKTESESNKVLDQYAGLAKPEPVAPQSSDLLSEAKKYKSAEEFVKAQTARPDYGYGHSPNSDGVPAFDLTQKVDGEQMIPKDMYSQWYGSRGTKSDLESIAVLKKIKGNPEADVTIYRASPKNEWNYGDWITLSKDYAKQHAEGNNFNLFSKTVKAKDIRWAMDDVNEFGYFPESTKSQLTDIWNQANKEIKQIVVKPKELKPRYLASLRKLGLQEPQKLITKREDILLKERLRNQARGAKEGIKYYKRLQAFLDRVDRQVKTELNKPKARQRRAIAFTKQLGDFNQTVLSEIKKELEITKSINEMNLEELSSFLTKLKERLQFKIDRGYRPTREGISENDSPKKQLTEDDYSLNYEIASTYLGKTQKKNTIGKMLSKTLAPLSTRLGNIDPSLKYALRRFEFNLLASLQKDRNSIKEFLLKTNKIPAKDGTNLDLALKNGDIEKINEITKKNGIENEYKEIQKVLDDIYERANSVGFDIGYQRNYFPRVIKDSAGFLEYMGKQEYWSILDIAIKSKEMMLGRNLTVDEKATLINTMVRGYQGGQITLSGTGAMKERKIDLVTPELNKFYYDFQSSLVKYIEGVNEKIEARKFFGKGGKAEGFNNIDQSIGAYTSKLLADGKITPRQEMELRDILNARFNPSGTHGAIGVFRNLAYIDVMGSFLNAVTQLGDQAWAIYRSGLWGTLKADVKAIMGRSKITKETLGIEANSVAQEFAETGATARMVERVFKLTGLNKIDRLGKEALVNSAIQKYQKLAYNPTKDFIDKITTIFGKDSDSVLAELRSGEIGENTKLLAFNELLDFHPVSLSEMPETYLKAGNGRIFYMLKSYTLKQFDIFRREAFAEMKKGNWIKGIKNLLYLASLVIIANGTADEIKDFLTNRKTSWTDQMLNQLFKLAGFSRYSAGKITEQGIGGAITEQIAPPTNFVDNVIKDVTKMYTNFEESAKINKLRTVQDIPLIGKFYYYWFGKGAEDTKRYAKPEPSKTNIGIPSIKIPSIKIPSINIPNIKL